MAAHAAGGPGSFQNQTNQIKTNLIKTMILVCVLFAVTWAPANVYALLLNINFKLTLREKTARLLFSLPSFSVCTF